jgi:hypothetical protein
MKTSRLLEWLTERDLALLASASGSTPDLLRSEAERIDQLVGSPEVFDRLFAPWSDDPLLVASPFLVFSTLLARTATELNQASFVREWIGPNRRLPVFDVEGLRTFAADPNLRIFLAHVLASYTHVVSGSVLVRGTRGWTRRRFSELDPVSMAQLADVVPPSERPAVLRRLGDVTLFLAGVFPDQAGERLFRPVQLERLQRAMHFLPGDGEPDDAPPPLGLLERLGQGSYRVAWRETLTPWPDGDVLREVADRFGQARRVLNTLTERFVFPRREEWFAAG